MSEDDLFYSFTHFIRRQIENEMKIINSVINEWKFVTDMLVTKIRRDQGWIVVFLDSDGAHYYGADWGYLYQAKFPLEIKERPSRDKHYYVFDY